MCGSQAGPDNPCTGADQKEGIRKEAAAGKQAETEEIKKTKSNSDGEGSSVFKVKKLKGGKGI